MKSGRAREIPPSVTFALPNVDTRLGERRIVVVGAGPLKGVAGVVEKINIFTTTMRTGDNREIIVPNGWTDWMESTSV